MTKTVFGVMPTGEAVEKVVLKGGGLTASILTFGAVLQDLRLEGHDAPLVLGFEDLASYLDHSPYFGATPGRCANRIGDGRFTLDGTAYQLELNEKGVSHLHGGSDGMGRQNWTILDHGADFVVMEIADPEGRAGYPGTTRTRATFALKAGGAFSALYETVTDKPTIANVCHHAYFNLDGRPDILGHDLMIAADHYTPVDDRLIPTGEIRPVENTAFDFREMRPIRLAVDGEQLGYDHNFCFSSTRVAKRSVTLARSVNSGLTMEILTTEPGVQFYAGGKVAPAVPGLEGRRYGAFAGFCMETQVWPDAINHPNFPNAVLRPGEVLRQETDYVFSRA
ncbi:aldose epimerase family protein [Rhizobium rhizophilum]|uniref:Aldose 1-epimerase n=1 Tax=Rhizobium rhizophilum TaxID=1850373 RepID=A0ABY2QT69_9HYPH|nr:aldose epimerase family protein [Rhizobium rhizophilum]THV11878.1 galactose mutarotase [Rhizobium rhizophilum]